MPEWTDVAVAATLANYEDLLARARQVAGMVYSLRYPRDGEQSFDVNLIYDDPPYYTYTASYYLRSNNHVLHIPLDYLWEPDDDLLRQREQERIEAERQTAETQRKLREVAEALEREASERKMLERLKKKYGEKGS